MSLERTAAQVVRLRRPILRLSNERQLRGGMPLEYLRVNCDPILQVAAFEQPKLNEMAGA